MEKISPFLRVGAFFTMLLTANLLSAQSTVTGRVEQNGAPISEVYVSQEGTNTETQTDKDGNYEIQTEGADPVLVFRHPDYAEEKTKVNHLKQINISLSERMNKIDEVVLNAGYYKVKERESTGSISKVTAKDIENQPVNNVLSAVQGRMAGVSITQNSGTPGGGFDVQIRGRNSLRNSLNSLNDGNQPLFIIDGVPLTGQVPSAYSVGPIPLRSISPLNNINPNDIESIEILKDADATAIYGSRGGNGVVLITTKKGKASPVRLTLNTSQSYSQVVRKLELMNTEEYVNMRRQAYANAGITVLPSNAYDINGTWDVTRYTDWQKELIGKTAENSSVQLSVYGGSEKNTFFVSAAHQDQTSVFPGDQHYKSSTINTHFNHQSTNRRFVLGLTNTLAETINNTLNSDYTKNALNLAPNSPALYDSAGNLNWQNGTFANPLAMLYSTYSNKVKFLSQNLNLEYKPFSSVTVKVNGGLNYQDLEEFSLSPYTMYAPGSVSNSGPAYSSASRGTGMVFSYLLEPQVMWSKKTGQHEWQALVGTTFQQSETKSTGMRGTGFASNALIENIAAATTVTLSAFTDTEYRYAALFGRVNYQYKNRYILNLTARRDGSSRFGASNRFANFGAIGAAWILTEEPFLKNISWLSFAKARGSIGRTGSDAIGDFQFTDTYTLSTIAYNGIPGLYPSRLYNPDYSWEKTDKVEAALELSLFSNRVNVMAAWYRNRSSNQLVGIPLPATTGFTSLLANSAATVENSGYEMEISAVALQTADWKWTMGFNLTMPKNKLIAFPGLEGSTYANTYVIGESIYVAKLFDYRGIDPATGKYVFTDYNGDGKITSPDDAKALRTLGPKYYGGIQNSLRYKNINLTFLLQFVKQEGWNYFRNMGTPGNMANQPAALLNVWSTGNPNGIIMPYSPGTDAAYNTLNNNFKNSTAAVSDASYVRLKNIQFNYEIPLRNSIIRQATVYAQGQNLWTWTHYFGMDPEFVTSGYVPPLKTFSLGLQLTL